MRLALCICNDSIHQGHEADDTSPREPRMYRIRHSTGDELTLASMDELAAAVAAGRVTADAEIYHQRADRWLAIASHPHFKLAAERAQALAKPAKRPAMPTPAPAPMPPAAPSADLGGAPTLRLIKQADEAAPRVTTRWKEPPRLVKQPMALRSPSSAVPAPSAEPTPEATTARAEPAAPAPAAGPEPVKIQAPEVRPQPVIQAPPPPAAESAKPVRTHVDRATAGLPLLDVGEMPPLPPRAPTPKPSSRPVFDPAKLGLSGTSSRAATPAPAPRAPTPMPAPSAARQPTPMPAPAVTRQPTPMPAPSATRQPTPMPAPRQPTPMPAPVARPMMATPPDSLDVPPPVRDFSEPWAPPAAATASAPAVEPPQTVVPQQAPVAMTPAPAAVPPVVEAIAPVRLPTPLPAPTVTMAAEPAHPGIAPTREGATQVGAGVVEEDPFVVVDASLMEPAELPSLPMGGAPARRPAWPVMVACALALVALAFVFLRPRTSMETLAPAATAPSGAATPVATAPARASTVAAPNSFGGTGRPALVVDVPEGPPSSSAPAAATTDAPDEELVPAAPRLGAMPSTGNLGALAPSGLEIDPTAAQRQRSLEETRRRIDSQLRQPQQP
jgi:hypothetical protein